MLRKILALTVLVSLTIAACKKDDTEDTSPNPPSGSDLWGQGVSASVYGTVIDENGNAVAGATVNAGNNTATTDAQGVFRINGFNAYQNLGYVTVNKSGYFEGSRSFVPVSGGNRVSIRLLSNAPDGNVSAIIGGSVSDQGATITLPANGIVKNNAPFTGNVRVSIRHIDTRSDSFSEEMPGNLIGVQNNQRRGLVSYGMVAVELTDNAGQPLQLATGQTATVRFPIATQQLATAPASIDLWSFDEQNGYWKHEGVATKIGGEYEAEVSHFSFWNCDIPWDLVTLSGSILNNSNGQAIQGAVVSLVNNFNDTARAITNVIGQFSGWVPTNQTFQMIVDLPCAGSSTGTVTVLTQTIGPFNVNTVLNPILVNLPSATQVSGSLVDCNGNPLSNGFFFAGGQLYFTNNDGSFNMAVCGTSITVAPFGTNPLLAGAIQNFTLTSSVQNLGNITVCSGVTAIIDVDGNSYSTVQIGNQVWMQENLRTTRYNNGDLIATGLNSVQWQNANAWAWSYYRDSTPCNLPYGKLYNWYAVSDSRGVCPTNWHVPTNAEW
ncbi:MAG: FISUMP domain-containing protein, partial [Bacteroidota bacterium]